MPEVPHRRDAARNRGLLLDAARRIVAERGTEVPLDEIAREAGVSRTTLHRHFANREDLALAVLRDNVADIEQRASSLADVPDGAVQLYHYLLDVQLDVPWLAQMISQGPREGRSTRATSELSDRTLAALEPLVEAAHREGLLHSSVTAADMLLTLPMAMTVLVVDRQAPAGPLIGRVRAILHRGLFTTEPPQ